MNISYNDKSILRSLAEKVAAIAALPVHKEKAELWTQLNDLRNPRPLVWINEICWHEMNVNDELTLCCENELARMAEDQMRKQIYQWNHLPADMLIEPIFYAHTFINDTGFGIKLEEETIVQAQGDISSHGYKPVITDENDIEKIKNPVLSLDTEKNEKYLGMLNEAFGDVLEIKPYGIPTQWFSPWDQLVQWWGVQEAMMDLVMRPEMVHAAMERLTNAYLERLRQWQELNVLTFHNGNYRVGSGGLGCTSELPGSNYDPTRVLPQNQWGCAVAQIFGSVSPDMHEEFGLEYERRWTENFGLVYYGCCEPLHDKFEILKRNMPNLRKISCSPWCKVEKLCEQVQNDYVVSLKPNPAIFASDNWKIEEAERDLRASLEQSRGCNVEVIAKDLSTMRGEPQRLWEWSTMAIRVCSEYN
jgi:hypothetical protein